jgi:REP element-mobilizing transposase RayT
MANTYTQVYLHCILVVKFRQPHLKKSWRDEVYKYITGIVKKQGHLMFAINGVEDHLHMLIAMKPHEAISDLMRIVKTNSSKWINEQCFLHVPFRWQIGFACFSYSKNAVPKVVAYIENQESHHKKKTLKKELTDELKKFDVDYKEKYLFD